MTAISVHMGTAGNLFRALLLIAALAGLMVLALDPRPWERLGSALAPFEILVASERLTVTPATAREMVRQSQAHATAGSTEAEARVRALLAAELDPLFAELSARIPDYADWYFSVSGEYARMLMPVLQRIGVRDGDYLADRALTLVFGGEAFDRELTAIDARAQSVLAGHVQALHARWLQDLMELAANGQPPARERAPAEQLSLDALATEISGHGSSEFLQRISTSTAAAGGAGVTAPALARLLVQPGGAALTASAAAAKGAGRGAAKAGAAGATALGCAATGPAALPCALAVGGASWLAADWALLSVDEWRYRDALIADWERRLEGLRADLEAAMLERYLDAIAAWRGAMHLEIERSFSPIESVRSSAGGRT
ncbi:hypothetical protein [Thioalkalivibrio paradoxus]|uniref:Uncharacterized protein n=1 Tax=Thioalkalivibrio paradoxus ARh 1 TaxID=713585 RepID=W0DTB6_9GAMM|nr:hypothetical protein [Thioalkalivibrio paradoxus]AHF00126.1 hypothetical protein THITH_09965 [Thioalkalivibrio paradoxus ARh 1]